MNLKFNVNLVLNNETDLKKNPVQKLIIILKEGYIKSTCSWYTR